MYTEYLLGLLASGEEELINRHCRPYTSLCDFCSVEFDLIGDVETFDRDWNFVADAISYPVRWLHV